MENYVKVFSSIINQINLIILRQKFLLLQIHYPIENNLLTPINLMPIPIEFDLCHSISPGSKWHKHFGAVGALFHPISFHTFFSGRHRSWAVRGCVGERDNVSFTSAQWLFISPVSLATTN